MWRYQRWQDKISCQESRRRTVSIGQQVMGSGLALYPIALTARSCLGRKYKIIYALDMGLCLRTFPQLAMVAVRSSILRAPYHYQRAALFCSGMTTLQRSGTPLDPGPLFLALYPTNLKSTVGQCRGKRPGPERDGKGRQTKVAGTFPESPKGAEEIDGQETGRLR